MGPERRHDRPDVGDEAQRGAGGAPEQRIRHPEHPQPDGTDRAVDGIDQRLQQQLPADPPARLVEGLGGDGEVTVPNQADQAVPQILAFEQHEQDEDDDETGGAGGRHEGTQPAETRNAEVARHHHGLRDGSGGCRRHTHVALDVLQSGLQALDRTAAAGAAHVAHLGADVGPVGDQIGAEGAHLAGHAPHRQPQPREHQDDHQQHGGGPPDATLQPDHRRRQDERQQDGQTHGHQDRLGPVEHCHNQRAARKRGPRLERTESVSHRRSP